MSKRTFVLVMAFALAAVLATGGLMASNMGFKLGQSFYGFGVIPGGESDATNSGENHFAIPFYAHLGLTNAGSLKTDVESGAGCAGNVQFVQRFDPAADQRESWFGAKIGGTNFNIAPCQSYFTTISSGNTCAYLNAGTHNPTTDCTFNGVGQGGSIVPENTYSLPFHTTANNAANLLTEVSAANFVQRYDQLEDQRQSWFGAKIGGTNFDITPGEGYFIQMGSGQTTTIKPDHY